MNKNEPKSIFDDISSFNNEIKKPIKNDLVNHPNHYNGHKIKTEKGEFEYETIDLISATVDRLVKDGIPASAAYCIGNSIKYIDRCAEKAGDYGKDQTQKNIEELRKAAWYLEKAAKIIEKN